ncbi:hypothetical protein [Cryobacterium ruanii]|uniref:Uncharacterized protein n=1 Tax=Cryobacterium ruanii TaxID=1259197 RepID=A0A4V3ITM3_9MICO|nr:hypothetical protein [Cryobacterium ruanii]TFD67981.1 hypothetical protein E3T47_05150 [Cryobacterium ruanii]
MNIDLSDEIPTPQPGVFTRLRTAFTAQTTKVRAISKTRKVILASTLAATLVVGGTFGGFAAVAAVQEAAHTSALTAHQDATVTLAAALKSDAQADTDLTAELAAASVLDAQVLALVAATDGLVDAEARAALEAARVELTATATDIATAQGLDLATGAVIETVSVPKAPSVKDTATTDSILESTVAVEKLTTAAGTELKSVTALSADLTAATNSVTDTFPALTESVATAGQARLDTTPSAGAPERDALAAAIAAVLDDSDALTALTVYTTAAAATTASHEAAVAAEAAAAAQAAADAAARATAPRSYTGGGSGAGKSSGGGSSSGGGAAAGGGAATGGDAPVAGGGGGSYLTGDQPWYPLQVRPGGLPCSGSGGGQEVTYGSTLMPPTDAYSTSTYEIAGYGWGITWTCSHGW